MDTHWARGGYPDSFLTAEEGESLRWREDFITSHVERYLPQLGIEASPVVLRRLCTMLAHQQGATLNQSRLGSSLGISGKTVRHYLDLLEGLYLMRILPPWTRNVAKRLVKSPKLYWRDSGILHALMGLQSLEEVLGHPVCGTSWEGYCIEQITLAAPRNTVFSHYRTHAGAEVDLVMEHPGGEVVAVEIKRTLSPKLSPGLLECMTTLEADRGVIVIPEGETFPRSETVCAFGLSEFLDALMR
jgi:predicted AAA+ superfamily ATPase